MRLVFSTSVIAAAVASVYASVASAENDRLILQLNGHMSTIGAYIDQSNLDGLDDLALAVDSGIYGSASLPFDNGNEVGARVALDLDYATNFDSVLNDAGSSSVIEEAWMYWDSSFGRLQLGLQDGAADVMGLDVPSVTSNIRVDNPEVFLLGFPCRNFCSSKSQRPGSLFSPNGMQLRSDIHGSDSYLKAMYVSPDLAGLRVAASYAPDGTRDIGELFGRDELNEQGNIWDVAASYLRTIGDVDFGVSAGYVKGENVNNSSPGYFGDLEEWGAAANLGYREWTIGAAWRKTNVAGGGPVTAFNVLDDRYTEILSVGIRYDTGPWAFGVNYVEADAELPFSSNQQGSGWQVAAAYSLTESIRFSAGHQRYQFDGPLNACFTDAGGGGCDTLDGNVTYLETTLSF